MYWYQFNYHILPVFPFDAWLQWDRSLGKLNMFSLVKTDVRHLLN